MTARYTESCLLRQTPKKQAQLKQKKRFILNIKIKSQFTFLIFSTTHLFFIFYSSSQRLQAVHFAVLKSLHICLSEIKKGRKFRLSALLSITFRNSKLHKTPVSDIVFIKKQRPIQPLPPVQQYHTASFIPQKVMRYTVSRTLLSHCI